jgi:hypothetical protein
MQQHWDKALMAAATKVCGLTPAWRNAHFIEISSFHFLFETNAAILDNTASAGYMNF